MHLEFADGVRGDVDLGELLKFRGVFASLRDAGEFARVRVDPELGTIVWPSGADICPDVLYDRVVGRSMPDPLGGVGSPSANHPATSREPERP